jgi:hypothetical protein
VPSASRHPQRVAEIVERRPLLLEPDAPWPHVRAASAAVALPDGRLLVVQDDTTYVALVGARTEPQFLPARDELVLFDARSGTKLRKPDLEAASLMSLGDHTVVVAMGSGSTSQRERLVVIPVSPAIAGAEWEEPPWAVDAPELYAALRAALGAPLNVEGLILQEGSERVRVLQRGNGVGGVDAVLSFPKSWLLERLDPQCPPLEPPRIEVELWELGTLGGGRLSFTDGFGCLDGSFMFLASAELTDNPVDDGLVTGSALGWAGPEGGWWAPLVGSGGEVVPLKAEGLAPTDTPDRWLITVDPDDVDLPSELVTVQLR